MTSIDARNRALWAVLGLALITAGAVGVGAYSADLGALGPDSPVLWSWAASTWRTAGTGTAIAVGAVGLVLLLLGTLLIKAQLQVPRWHAPTLQFGDADAAGVTELRAAALPKALERAVCQVPGVTGATVRICGDGAGLSARIRVDLSRTARMQLVVPAVDKCLDRFAGTVGTPVDDATVTVHVQPALPPARVS